MPKPRHRDIPGLDILARLRARFDQRRPVRAGSLIVTLYGDAIAPRGGTLWLGSINQLVAPFGIEPGLVRTAMSRLVGDGWFERNRVGKNSYYRLSPKGAAAFAAAGERIYRSADPPWDGRLRLAILSDADAKIRQGQRDALAASGFGQLAPNVMLHPLANPPSDGSHETIQLEATAAGGPETLRKLAGECWRLDTLAAAFASYLEAIAPLAGNTKAVAALDDEHAFQVRLLLIHEWRRIVLHDPQLPQALLPPHWPGTAARVATRAVYKASTPGCERWLTLHAANETGPLQPPHRAHANRFT